MHSNVFVVVVVIIIVVVVAAVIDVAAAAVVCAVVAATVQQQRLEGVHERLELLLLQPRKGDAQVLAAVLVARSRCLSSASSAGGSSARYSAKGCVP